MRKAITKLIAILLLIVMMSSTTLAEYRPDFSGPSGMDSFIYIEEGFTTETGVFLPPGYYSWEDLLSLGINPNHFMGTDDPAGADEPTVPDDPAGSDDPTVPDDPAGSDEPTVPDIPVDPIIPDAPEQNPELSRQIVRIGLRYGNDVMDGANLANSVGSGFRFGYYDSNNTFIPLGYTTHTTISVVKTENVYYGTPSGYTSYYDHITSNVGVGCYHLQLGGGYGSFEEAYAIASQYSGGFVAFIGGVYYVRIGNYLVRDNAVAAQENLAASGISTELKGTSSYAVSVVVTGTNTIVFQYDDNGSGTGLGVEPIAAAEGQKCISLFAGTRYYGGFRYERIDGGDLTIVNMIAVDDYVKGVICNEMSPSWPIEALKAQAVCARSYVLHNLNSHRKHHFDACTTVCCQAYGGVTKATSDTDYAVDSTMGIVASYNGTVANTVFYSSNGGASEASSTVWGSNQSRYPYLVGVVDPYEATVKISGYEWTRTWTGKELATLLQNAGYKKCSKIVSVKITEYTATGNPAWVDFTDDQGKVWTLNAKAVNDALPLRSWRYEFANSAEINLTINGETPVDTLTGLYALDQNGNLVLVQDHAYIITDDGVISSEGSGAVTGDTFTIVGRGWGHNVGMSQYGACAMAKLGYTYDQILKFYYTGITVG